MKVVTLACSDRGAVAVPRDLDGVAYVEDLCRNPGDISALIDGADRLVMIVHLGDLFLAHVQQSVRTAGIDPLGVQYLPADAIAGDELRATMLLGGARARVAAYSDSQPEHARPTFGGHRSRREMLSVPKPHYEAVPLIDEGVCAAGHGCRACVTECPQTAYRWSRGRVHFDRDACVTCGLCVTVCPTGAIGTPTIGNRALVDQITTLVRSAAPEPLGIAFVCRQRTRPLTAVDWAEVEVPCTGMVPATWPIAALLVGARATAVVPCGSTGCGLGNDNRAADAVEIACQLLAGAGLQPEAVLTDPGALTEFPAETRGPVALENPFGTHGPAEVALALQSIAVTDEPLSALGRMASRAVVTIDTDACTLCLTCTETCPTGALHHRRNPGHVAVTFDAALCTGCNQCVPVCPEIERGAISTQQRIDTGALRAGRQTLAESATAECELCGAPIASAAMLARISQLLGGEHDAAKDYLERRCMACRGAG